jgi:hypothetical protein
LVVVRRIQVLVKESGGGLEMISIRDLGEKDEESQMDLKDKALICLSATYGAAVRDKYNGSDSLRRNLQFAIEGVDQELEDLCIGAMYFCIHGETVDSAVSKVIRSL